MKLRVTLRIRTELVKCLAWIAYHPTTKMPDRLNVSDLDNRMEHHIRKRQVPVDGRCEIVALRAQFKTQKARCGRAIELLDF